jgi:hypothetical protein
MSLHSNILSWFRAIPSLLLLLNLCAYRRSSKDHIYCLRFNPTGARTHELLHEAIMLTNTPQMHVFITCWWERKWLRSFSLLALSYRVYIFLTGSFCYIYNLVRSQFRHSCINIATSRVQLPTFTSFITAI